MSVSISEVRLGNLFLDDKNEYGHIVPETLMFWNDYKNVLQPIEITEWFLSKTNAKKYKQGFWDRLQFGKEVYYDIYELRLIYKKGTFYYAILGNDKEIKYVHQLQNLVFALMGEEMEINLLKHDNQN